MGWVRVPVVTGRTWEIGILADLYSFPVIGPTPPGCSADAFMRWLEEEEAERIKSVEEEEDGHDGAGDAADKVPEKPDTKPKD